VSSVPHRLGPYNFIIKKNFSNEIIFQKKFSFSD